ncbi:conserved hypothetical protein [Leishmania braziliensis MHOM/BR/75/M2904]|uniref:Uncharacterized protein n=1 Tax=Leishmania braziliensis TaxID=5660 RepID=A4HCA8_LEIBR|nr:conserved hypothetical protein [Leishmania braziliensis MHOM/BR/75/M2904]CAJ2472783.1 unnamed protein product [Leishmania braziliensis]CAM45101.1 conserved hypothetical protein [Leishmania braziliensis MHOM/BR/75/M2904]
MFTSHHRLLPLLTFLFPFPPYVQRPLSDLHHYTNRTCATEGVTYGVLLRGMRLINSTASTESCGAVDSVHLIHSICALDDHTLVFAIATTACVNSAAGGSFGAVRFSLREASDDAAKEKSCGPRPLSCDTSPTGVLRSALYARSLKASRGADFSSSAHEECNEYPECCSGADSAGGVGNSLTMPTLGSHSRQSCLPLERAAPAWAATVASLSERSRDSLAVLRALQVSPSLHLCGAASKEPPAGTPPTSFQPSPSHVSGDALVALHVVRQEAWQCSPDAASTATQFTMAHNASSATLLSTDVLCYFDCGCAALATFKLTRRLPASEWSVQLSECAWIPSATSPRSAPSRGGGAVKGGTSLSTYETGVPLVSSLVRPLPTTASLATCADDNHDGRNSLLELLVVWCSPTVASSSSGFSLLSCTRPVARYTSLRCCCRAPATTSTVEREWRLHSQAIFDMSELLNVAPSASLSSKGVHDCASLCNVLPHSSVRSLSWLPGTADFTQSYPLLAVLYAAPTVQACHVNSVGGIPTELCLDSLAVCYLKEDGHNLNAVTTPHKTPPMVTGRLLVGPWSVRGLSLAHPQFLFATALAGLRSPLSHPPLAMNARFAAGPVASASPSAAQVFRATLHSSADEAAAVLGVFQRPVQEPYAPSSVFRSVATTISRRRHGGKAMAGTPLANGNMARLRELSQLQYAGGEPDNLSAPRNSKAFAFVLYGSEGEVARCVLDGYVEDAQTTWLAPRIMPAHKDGNSRATGDVLGRGDEGVSRTVAHVCALLSEKPSTLSAAKVHWHSAVVIAIQAQWTRAPPMVAERWHDNEPCSRSRSSAGDHWSFSVQVTQRLRSSGVPGGVLSRPWCATPLTMVGRILCWRSAAADCDTTSGDVSCLVCGYATIPHHGGTASSVVDASDNILLEGVFELWLSASVMSSSDDGSGRPATVTPATNATLGIEQRRGTETSSAAASLPQSTAGLCPWAVGSCTRVASPSAFSAVLHNASTTDTLATAFDLLSHTPTFLVSAARFGSTVSDGVVPVALAWVGGGVEADIDNLARAAPSLSGATTPSKASLLSCVRQLDAVALLRSGDVVGWRCTSSFSAAATAAGIPSGEGVVLHLGVIWRGLAHGTTQPLNELFCKLLLGSGIGADAVHMEVVTSPMEDKSRRVDHRQAGVGESAMEGRSSSSASLVAEMAAKGTVLLVLAVGSLVGVVDLAAEAVVFVRDLRADLPGISEREGDTIGRRAASPATADGATTLVTASVLRLQRLPVVTPCGWMAAGEVAQQGAGAAVGESWYFVWSGATEPQRGHSSLAFVLRLSFLRWVDVVSAHVGAASNSAAGGAAPTASVFDTEPSPAPLVTLQVDVRLQGEAKPPGYSAAVSSVSPPPPSHHLSVSRSCSSATAYIGWLLCPTGCADDGVGCAAPRGTTANVEAAASSGDTAGYLPLLSVCDAALLRSLWPTMSTDEIKMSMSQNCASSLPGAVVPRHRPPLRLFRWGGVVLQPSIPSSLLLHHQIGAACVMEQLARDGATTRLGMPLHVVHRSLLGESHDANTTLTPPEKGRGVDLLCGLTCRQVLYVSTLTLDVRADGGRRDEHEPVLQERTVSRSPSPAVHGAQPACSSSDPTPWHVLLCTVLLDKGEQTSRSNESAETFSGTSASFDVGAASATAMRIDRGEGQAASYLLCGLPARVSAVPPQQKPRAAAVTHPSPLFTWHWIPLHVAASFPAPSDCGSGGMAPAGIVSTGSGGVEQNLAPLAITRVLPLPSPKRFSPAALPPTHAATVSAKSVPHAVAPGSYFYCEGMLSDPAVPGAPHGQEASYYLIVQGGRLRRLLERSAAAAALTDDFEQVYMYTTVDPDLVRVVDTSLASHVRVPR